MKRRVFPTIELFYKMFLLMLGKWLCKDCRKVQAIKGCPRQKGQHSHLWVQEGRELMKNTDWRCENCSSWAFYASNWKWIVSIQPFLQLMRWIYTWAFQIKLNVEMFSLSLNNRLFSLFTFGGANMVKLDEVTTSRFKISIQFFV